MTLPPPPPADLIARAIIAATISLADDPQGVGLSARAQSRRSRAAAASAIARLWARPVGRVAKWVNLRAEQVWSAQGERQPAFVRAEREAAALLRACSGEVLAADDEASPADDTAEERDGAVVRLKSVSPGVARWASAYVRRGVAVSDLADLFDVDADALELAVVASGAGR